MPMLKPAFWESTNLDRGCYRTYVETGSYRGFMIEHVIDEYDVIHSIELSSRWYRYCLDKFGNSEHVHLHEGDSRAVLPSLLEGVAEPAVIFLDAHYSGGTTARAERDTPLLEELEIVGRRQYPDIIIVDDISFLGKKGGSEPTEPISADIVWPRFAFDRSETTELEVLARLKPGYALVNNQGHLMTSSPREDQYVLYPSIPKLDSG
jgi:hypothetical protein